MNNVAKIITLLVVFASGAFAHSFYFKPAKDLVKLEITKSGKFVLTDGHIYELNELEVVTKPTSLPDYSEGASQSYHLPTGRK